MALYTYGSTGASVFLDAAGNARGELAVEVIDPSTGAKVPKLFEKDGSTEIPVLKTNRLGGPQPGALREFRTSVPGILYRFKDGAADVQWWELSREAAAEAKKTAADASTLAGNAIPKTQLGAANGVAQLDADKFLPPTQLKPVEVHWSALKTAFHPSKGSKDPQTFPAADWPPIEIVVPPSGYLRITISGMTTQWKVYKGPVLYSLALQAKVTSDKSGKNVLRTTAQRNGTGVLAAERSGIYPFPAGSTVYVFPQFVVGENGIATGTDTMINSGDLIVEALPTLGFYRDPPFNRLDPDNDPAYALEMKAFL